MHAFTVLSVFILLVASTQATRGVTCPSGEHPVLYCPRRVEPSCDNPSFHNIQEGPCAAPECFCISPTVRNTETGHCIDYSECPKIIRD